MSALDLVLEMTGGPPTGGFRLQSGGDPRTGLPLQFGGDTGFGGFGLRTGGDTGFGGFGLRTGGDTGFGGFGLRTGGDSIFGGLPLRIEDGPAGIRARKLPTPAEEQAAKEAAQPGAKAARVAAAAQALQAATQGRPPAASNPAVAGIELSNLGPSQRPEFLHRAMRLGLAMEAQTGIPAEVFAAMAANESNFGNAAGNIMGGVKASPDDPNAVWHDTWEMVNGQRVQMRQPFVASATPLQGMERVAATLQSGRYAPAYQRLAAGQIDRDQFLRQVNAAGYATNPNWAQGEIVPLMGEAAQYRQAAAQANAASAPAPLLGGTDLVTRLTSPFSGMPYDITFDVGQRYDRPLSGGTTHHRGVDLVPQRGGIGTTVTALAGGSVVPFRQGGDQGNAVVLQAADGLYHAYFHLRDVNTLPPGTIIHAGDPIGVMGQSGTEGNPHLHLEVRRNLNSGDPRGQVIDPLQYFGLR